MTVPLILEVYYSIKLWTGSFKKREKILQPGKFLFRIKTCQHLAVSRAIFRYNATQYTEQRKKQARV